MLRDAPRRVLALNKIYSKHGGLAPYLLGRIDSGARVSDLADELSEKLGETISSSTVYGWIVRFRAEKGAEAGANT